MSILNGMDFKRPACIWGGMFKNMTGWKNSKQTASKIYINVNCYLLGNSCILTIVLGTLYVVSLNTTTKPGS